jgi:uracil-DNA glycosylase
MGWMAVRGKFQGCTKCGGAGKIFAAEPKAPSISTHFKIAIVGEAFGEEEERLGMPFVGYSGRELNRMLEEADIARSDCYVTNVFNLRPKPTNDIKNLGTTRKLSSVPMPEMSKNLFLQDQYFPEVERLWRELKELSPNLVIALGNTALWALTGSYGIRGTRGTVVPASFCNDLKVLPTYHPAAVMRDWSLRSIVIADLMKAKRQSAFPEIRRPARELWLEPTLNHLELFFHHYVKDKCQKLSFDIETAGNSQITCIGFAPSPKLAIVVPFVDNRNPTGSYWSSLEEEVKAWKWVGRYLSATPEIEKIGQNTLYDINWLWHKVGITPRNYSRDTMLKHHAINPEHEKGLGFLGSIYTDEPAWKLMRGRGKGTIKKGE